MERKWIMLNMHIGLMIMGIFCYVQLGVTHDYDWIWIGILCNVLQFFMILYESLRS